MDEWVSVWWIDGWVSGGWVGEWWVSGGKKVVKIFQHKHSQIAHLTSTTLSTIKLSTHTLTSNHTPSTTLHQTPTQPHPLQHPPNHTPSNTHPTTPPQTPTQPHPLKHPPNHTPSNTHLQNDVLETPVVAVLADDVAENVDEEGAFLLVPQRLLACGGRKVGWLEWGEEGWLE